MRRRSTAPSSPVTRTCRSLPASVAKLVTTTAALDRLGPDFTFSSQLWADGLLGEKKKSGVLHGNLVVRGGGILVTERLWLLSSRGARSRGSAR
ncbi:MAG: D-alanyl-D-alanine carboxypeptidase [Candidatus Eisenbacteria bacterium]